MTSLLSFQKRCHLFWFSAIVFIAQVSHFSNGGLLIFKHTHTHSADIYRQPKHTHMHTFSIKHTRTSLTHNSEYVRREDLKDVFPILNLMLKLFLDLPWTKRSVTVQTENGRNMSLTFRCRNNENMCFNFKPRSKGWNVLIIQWNYTLSECTS